MSKGSQTVSQQTGPPAWLGTAQQAVQQRAQDVSQTPWAPYVGESVAQFTPEQNLALSNINQSSGLAAPYFGSAEAMAAGAVNPLTPEQVAFYFNPYQQQVTQTTEDWLNKLNQQAIQGVTGNAVSQGALDNNRVPIAQGEVLSQLMQSEAPTIAGIQQQGYTQALATAAQQLQQNPEAVAALMGTLGQGAQGAALQGAQAQFGAGTAQQQTQQQQDYFNIQQYFMQQGFPFQEAQWYAGILSGLAPSAGYQSTTTGPAPSGLAAGLGGIGTLLGGAGLFMSGMPKSKTGGRVKGYQAGGSPFGGGLADPSSQYYSSMMPAMPYNIGKSYVPMPRQMSGSQAHQFAPTPGQFEGMIGGQGGSPGGGMDSLGNLLKGMGQFGKGLGSTGSSVPYGDPTEAAQAADAGAWPAAADIGPPGLAGAADPALGFAGDVGVGSVADVIGGSAGLDLAGGLGMGEAAGLGADLGIGAAADIGAAGGADALAMLPLLLVQSGGRINYPGGLSLPDRGRIQLPMRGGLGMPSFVRRPGMQAGGSPFDTPSFESSDAEAMRQHALDVQAYDLSPTADATQTFDAEPPAGWVPTWGGSTTPQSVGLSGPVNEQGLPTAAADLPVEIRTGQSRPGVGGTSRLGYAAEEPTGGLGGGYQLPPRLPPSYRPSIWGGAGGVSGPGGPGQPGFLGFSPEFYASLMAAGLGTMAAARPGVPWWAAVGAGGQQGLQTYGGLKKGEIDVEMEARKLDQSAQQEADRIRMEGRRINIEQQREERETRTPHLLGERVIYSEQGYPIRSEHVYGMYNPQNKRWEDTQGNPVDLSKLHAGPEAPSGPQPYPANPPAATAGPPTTQQPPFQTYQNKGGRVGYQDGGMPSYMQKPQDPSQNIPAAPTDAAIAPAVSVEDTGPSAERPYRGVPATMATERAARARGLHGQAYLDAVPDDFRNTVEAAGNYQAPMSTFATSARFNPLTGRQLSKSEAEGMVKQFNPDHDDSYYPTISKTYSTFFVPGSAQAPASRSLRLNTAMTHAGDMAEAMYTLQQDPKLQGVLQAARQSGFPIGSYLAAHAQQYLLRGTPSGEAFNRLLAVEPVYTHETATYYTPTGGTEHSRQAFGAPYDPSLSFPEQMGALQLQMKMFGALSKPMEQDYKEALDAPGLRQYGTRGEFKQWHNVKEQAQAANDRVDELYNLSHPTGAAEWIKQHPMDPKAAYLKQVLGIQ